MAFAPEAFFRNNYGYAPFKLLTDVNASRAEDYAKLSPDQKQAVLLYAYQNHLPSINDMPSGVQPPLYWACNRKLDHQDFFNLIVCSALIHNKRSDIDLIQHFPYDFHGEYATLAQVKEAFLAFKGQLATSDAVWFKDLSEAFGGTKPLEVFVDKQIKKIDAAIKGGLESKAADRKPKVDLLEKLFAGPKFEVVDHSALTKTEAVDDLKRLVGLSAVKQQIRTMATRLLYDRAREKTLGAAQEPRFNNFIFSGSPGVGKTTVAKKLGGILSAIGALPNQKSIVVSAHDLIGEYVGHTEKAIKALIEQGRGGLIVIDETDALSPDKPTSFHETAINALNALIGYEKDNSTGTVFVFTGYPDGIDKLFRQNQGL